MKTLSELRELPVKDLQQEVLSLRKEQFNLRMKKANGSLEKTHPMRMVKKQIARVKTLMSEKVGGSNG